MSSAPVEVRTEDLTEDFESERPGRRLTRIPALVVSVAGVGLSLYAFYWVLNPLTPRSTARPSWPWPSR